MYIRCQGEEKNADYKGEGKQPDKVAEYTSLEILQKRLSHHPPELSDIYLARSHLKILLYLLSF